MATITAALIVKDAAHHLAACLDTVKDWVDEIVLLDSGSTDNTEEIARRYTDHFYVNANWQGFGIQRQRAQKYVTTDYILWLDADERVTPELQQSIQEVLEAPPQECAYRFSRLTWFLGGYVRHCGWHPDYVVRLYPTALTQYTDALVHEAVDTTNIAVHTLTGEALHYTYDALEPYLKKMLRYATLWAEQRYAEGKRTSLFYALLRGKLQFFVTYFIKRGFLDGKQGLLLSIVMAYYTFVKYATLWSYDRK